MGVVDRARKAGSLLATGGLAALVERAKRARGHSGLPRLVFIAPRVDSSGASSVLVDVIGDLVRKRGSSDGVLLVTPEVELVMQPLLERIGVTVVPLRSGAGPRAAALQLGLGKEDFVLLNTMNIDGGYRELVISLLERGRLAHAVWFVHEMEPHWFSNESRMARLRVLVASGRLTLVVPSLGAKRFVDEQFLTDQVCIAPLRLDLGDLPAGVTSPESFEMLRFVIVGTSLTGRKGQLLAIAALALCLPQVIAEPQRYRQFDLTLIGANEETDYHGRQLRAVGEGLLGDRIHVVKWLTREGVMELLADCNVTICSSFNETFNLANAEGMALGHVLVRNGSGGMEEQLLVGQNGVFVDSENVQAFSHVLLDVLDRSKHSNEALWAMGLQGRRVAATYKERDYVDVFGAWLQLEEP